MLNADALRQMLEQVAQGAIAPEAALDAIQTLETELVADFARIDHQRLLRTGFPEVIWGQDKTPEQIAAIMQAMGTRADGESRSPILATRVSPSAYTTIRSLLRSVRYYPLARICTLDSPTPSPIHPGQITLLSAGTADLPVAEEAAVTAELCGFRVERLWDVGVAGIHRLLDNRELLRRANVVIVVAGMEGALPSVVGGLVDCPVVAVPTSVGYGANFGGLAALLAMLNSCAAGIGVVNIDNGFGAAILAGQILRTASRLR